MRRFSGRYFQKGFEPETQKARFRILLHVTDLLSKRVDLVQTPWTRCNKFNNLQCCQGDIVIRILPEEPNFS
jgi:hypothetical protein